MDADKNNAPEVNVDESATSVEDNLLSAFDEIAESLPQNGGDGTESDGADDGAEPADGSDDYVDDGDDGEENAADDTETDEVDDDEGDGEDAQADDDTAEASEGEPSQEPVTAETSQTTRKEDRITARKLAAIEQYAKENGYSSVEEMIAEREGVDAEEIKRRFETEELTVEEKAALYDKEHATSQEAERASAEKRGHDLVLAQIHEAFPQTKDTVKDLRRDIKQPDRFLQLLMGGATPAEAFRATGNEPKRAAPPPNGKAHLRPELRSKRSGGTISVPASELSTLRRLFPDMSDAEIEKKYRSVNS